MRNTFRILLLGILLAAGCGKGHVGLEGKVVFTDDGSPLTIGTVCLATDSYQARGRLQKDGTFVAESYRRGDGLPPGSYRVGIRGASEDLGEDRSYPLVDPKWESPETSGHVVTVEKTVRNLEIKVDRNPRPREDYEKKR